MVENATMIPEGVVLEERTVRFLVRQCTSVVAILVLLDNSTPFPLDPLLET
jgi:hypothetical protein